MTFNEWKADMLASLRDAEEGFGGLRNTLQAALDEMNPSAAMSQQNQHTLQQD